MSSDSTDPALVGGDNPNPPPRVMFTPLDLNIAAHDIAEQRIKLNAAVRQHAALMAAAAILYDAAKLAAGSIPGFPAGAWQAIEIAEVAVKQFALSGEAPRSS